jgi:CRP/FNR family transcriptional regulator, cyclic AMP receptor protein
MLRRPNRGSEVSLRSLALFSRCSDRELRRVAHISTELEVEAGRVLTSVGRPNDQFFVIVSGIASVWREGVRLDVLQRGSFFGEGALGGRYVCSATVVADTRMRLMAMSRQEFISPHFLTLSVLEQMVKELSRRLRRAEIGLVAGKQFQELATTFEAPAVTYDS